MDSNGLRVGLGEIVSGTLGVLAARPIPFFAYAVGMGVMAASFDQASGGAGSLIVSVVGFVGGFSLLRHNFVAEGMSGSRRFGAGFLSYFGASLLSGLGIGLGIIFLIVPGLILMSRWSIATGLVVSEDAQAVDSMQRSWDITRASQWQILGAYVLYGLMALALFVAVGGAIGYSGIAIGMAADESTSIPVWFNFLLNAFVYSFSSIGIASVLFLTKRLTASKGELERVFS